MKRRLFKLVVFLLLGVIFNVAVAWGCALVPRLDAMNYSDLWGPSVEIPTWLSRSGRQLPSNYHLVISESEDMGYRVTRYLLTVKSGGSTGWPSVEARSIETGLPFLALRGASVNGESAYYDGRNHLVTPGRNHWAITVGAPLSPTQSVRPRLLPLLPIWPGFAINTIFYAAILSLLTLVPFTARRFVRRKRGLCIKCGYDLRGAEHEACPECGWHRVLEPVR